MQWTMFRRIACCGALAFATTLFAQNFKPYPGAKVDEKASSQTSDAARGVQSQVYTTSDSFDKVYAFYKSQYKEFTTPFPTQKLPSGQQVQWAFFTLDGGSDLVHSTYWMKIQRPYIGTVEDGSLDFKDIRDIAVIQTVHTRPRQLKKHF